MAAHVIPNNIRTNMQNKNLAVYKPYFSYVDPKTKKYKLFHTDLWHEFSDSPNVATKYKTFWLKWSFNPAGIVYVTAQFVNSDGVFAYYSKDEGLSWTKFEWQKTYLRSNDPFYKELFEEILEAKERFYLERQKDLNKKRKEALKLEAEKLDIDPEELAKQRSKEREEKTKEKQIKQKAKKMAKVTNEKMRLGLVIKELLEVGNLLQERMLNDSEMKMQYVDLRLPKITTAKAILEEWLKSK